MPHYYRDPDREPRDCDECDDRTYLYCARCNGTGRLGEEGAKPDVSVWSLGLHTPSEIYEPGWYVGAGKWPASCPLCEDDCDGHGPYPTESEALAAAREAARERKDD